MKFFIYLFFVLSSILMAMPPHPNVLHLKSHSIEKSSNVRGGIVSNIRSTRVRANSVSSRKSKIVVLRFNCRDTNEVDHLDNNETDIFTFGAADSAYDNVKATVEKYYKDQSKGKHEIELTFPSMTGLTSLSVSHSELAALSSSTQQAHLKLILNAYELLVDYSLFDAVIFMHAGTGQEILLSNSPGLIHSFRNTFGDPYYSKDGAYVHSFILLPEQYHGKVAETVGVIVHEYGHELGLPDLYDAQSSTNTNGIGNFGAMAGGSYGGPRYDGTKPTSFCAFSKIHLGWETPIIAENKSYVLKNPLVANNQILKIFAKGAQSPEEYFLITNRFNGDLGNGITNWDFYLPTDKTNDGANANTSTGFVIMHVDESVASLRTCENRFGNVVSAVFNRWDNGCLQHDRTHMFLDVEEATEDSGVQQLEFKDGESNSNDTWNQNTTKTFDNTSGLSKPYDNSLNGINLSFGSVNGKEMTVSVASNIQVIDVDSSIDKQIKVSFSKEINAPSNGDAVITPSLGTLSLTKSQNNVLTISTQNSINRQTSYVLSFPNLKSSDLQSIASLPNAFGTNITDYTLKGIEVWTKSKSPYLISKSDFIVRSTSQLVIESGTIILMDSGSYGGSFPTLKLDIQVEGTIIAKGTKDSPIQFLPVGEVLAKSWGTILFSGLGQKPSVFEHVKIKGCNTAFDIRDQLEHIISDVEINTCDVGFVFNDRGAFGDSGLFPDGGSSAKLYQVQINNSDIGMYIYSTNKNLEMINTLFNDYKTRGISFIASNSNSLKGFRFTEFKLSNDRGNIFDFTNNSSQSGTTLITADLNEIFISDKDGNDSLVSLNGGSTFFINNNTISQSVSRDFKITTMDFIGATSSIVKTKFITGESFRVKVVATTATNQNSDKKRVIGVLLNSETYEQVKFLSLEETSANSLEFISQVHSIHTSGATTGSFIWVGEQDTLKLESLDNQNKLLSLKVNEIVTVVQNPATFNSFTSQLINNKIELSYSFVTLNQETISQMYLQYSTDNSTWLTSTKVSQLETSTTQTNKSTWIAYTEFDPNFTGDLHLRLWAKASNASTFISTSSILSYSLTTETKSLDYTLNQGWNLLSVYPSDTQTAGDFFSVFDSLLSSCVYTYSGNGFSHFCPSGVSTDTSTSVALSGVLTWGQSFFINMKLGQNLAITSNFHPRNKINLKEGWNLKSLYKSSNEVVQNQLLGNSLIVSYQTTYEAYFLSTKNNTHTSITQTISDLDVKKGYWIYSPNTQEIKATESIFK
ncbi:MAG: hypothetical protein COB02_02600 [Candidatus Cloacimonadota bacterium]|nr:MAG: hypothetical protein COB02_02600 [Candidatus Cloacimonadota bacterium]